MKFRIFFRFTTVMILYYISCCAIMGFAALFMQSRGFTNTETGLFFTCSSFLCIVQQMLYAVALDRFPRLSARHFLLGFGVISILLGILLSFTTKKTVLFICYTLLNSCILTSSSLINTFGIEFVNAGIPLNFGLARGLGSLSYACSSLFLGNIISHYSVSVILPLHIATQCVLLLLLSLHTVNTPGSSTMPTELPSESSHNMLSFLRANPFLLLLFTGMLLLYFSYTVINNFHINIIEATGGGSRELGISTSIAALLELPAMAAFTPLSRKILPRTLLLISCVFFFLKISMLFFAGNIIDVYASQILQFFSYGIFVPASTYYINSILPPCDKMKGQSALGIFTFGLSGLISSLLCGALLDLFSVKIMLGCFSLLALAGLIITIIACRKLHAYETL